MTRVFALMLLLAGCGSDGGSPKRDAAVLADAPAGDSAVADAPPSDTMPADALVDAQAFVFEVVCDGSAKGPIATMGFAFDPQTLTINQNEAVEFMMPANHNVVPDPAAAMTDPGIQVGFAETKCLQFTATGTFGFKCMPHGFTGSITVQ